MKSPKKSNFSKGIFISITIVLLFISTLVLFSFDNRSDKENVIMTLVTQLAERDHVSPPKIDKRFSEKAFNAYLKLLDPNKWFLTKEDVKQMEVYKQQIDEQIKKNEYLLYELSVGLMDKRVIEVQGYYREILSKPFDFTTNESYEDDPDKRDWSANSTELKESWHKRLKYLTLIHVANALRAQENETDPSKIKTMETIESDARERVLKSRNDIFQNITQQKPEQRFQLYVNAILSVFDPHTLYNTPRDKERFDIRMSGQLEGIGATLQSSDGYAKVVQLMPGSPSWRQGELKVNDHITKVKQENEAEAVDIFGMTLDDAVQLIRGKKGTKVTITVKRGDGSIHDITLTRDIVIIEETFAKSAIITDPATKIKVGYIDLPSFYVDFKKSPTGRASSDDVAQEINKLKKDGVQGVILDLRTNTGGSLGDAIKMGGLFVPQGPIVQVQANNGGPRVHSNNSFNSSSALYDGPLVILVSTISASASEILAAAMQDYKRAVIVGAPNTFGKGTVQAVNDLDDYLPSSMGSLKPLGAMNLTIQKYYRITGGSVQLKGVESDIVLPDVYSVMKMEERYEDNRLPWTTVTPAKYTEWKKPVKVAELKKKSETRVSKSERFNLMNEQIEIIKNRGENSQVSLNLQSFQQEENKRREANKRFDENNKLPTSLTIAATSMDVAYMKGDTAKISRFEKWFQDLNKDIHIEEAVKIVGDMR